MKVTRMLPSQMLTVAEELRVFSEPPLEFRYGQAMADPHDGLAMFGPYDADLPSHPKNISYALIGTEQGMAAFRAWARTIQSPIYTDPDVDTRLWPMFPGFEAVFACTWPTEPSRVVQLDDTALTNAARDLDPNKRAALVVEQYLDGIARVSKRDDPVHVVVCVAPDLVWENCRPKSRVTGGVGYRIRADTRVTSASLASGTCSTRTTLRFISSRLISDGRSKRVRCAMASPSRSSASPPCG